MIIQNNKPFVNIFAEEGSASAVVGTVGQDIVGDVGGSTVGCGVFELHLSGNTLQSTPPVGDGDGIPVASDLLGEVVGI